MRLRGNTLVSGGSDGIVCVWSLLDMSLVHRLVGGENSSVTSLEFDHNRIVSGSSDGEVRVWDLATGEMTRELYGKNPGYVGNCGLAEHMAVLVRGFGASMVLEVSSSSSLQFFVLRYLSWADISANRFGISSHRKRSPPSTSPHPEPAANSRPALLSTPSKPHLPTAPLTPNSLSSHRNRSPPLTSSHLELAVELLLASLSTPSKTPLRTATPTPNSVSTIL